MLLRMVCFAKNKILNTAVMVSKLNTVQLNNNHLLSQIPKLPCYNIMIAACVCGFYKNPNLIMKSSSRCVWCCHYPSSKSWKVKTQPHLD